MWDNRLYLVLVVLCALVREGQTDIKIGAFNIQIFGQSKAGNPDVMNIIARIVAEYDILFIQEIRDISGLAIEQLMNDVNSNTSPETRYSIVISPRLGRTSSKEQYAYIYREASGVRLMEQGVYEDVRDEFERPPMVASFVYNGFVFAVVGVHIDPDTVPRELNALDGVVKLVKKMSGIGNILVVGDMNADCSYVANYEWEGISLRQNKEYVWYIGDGVDTTIKSTHCAYDRIIAYGPQWSNRIIQNSVRVNMFPEKYHLTYDEAAAVSDHFPVELIIRDSKSPNYSIRVPNVYIYLTDPSKSLFDKAYRLLKARDRLAFDVFDGIVQVGTIPDVETNMALFELYDDPTVEMVVKPVSFKYRNRQKADVYATRTN